MNNDPPPLPELGRWDGALLILHCSLLISVLSKDQSYEKTETMDGNSFVDGDVRQCFNRVGGGRG